MNYLKKIVLASMMLASVCTSVSAQGRGNSINDGTQDNWYMGVQGGILYNWGSNGSGVRFSRKIQQINLGLLAGKWLNPNFAVQLELTNGGNVNAAAINTFDDYTYYWNSLSAQVDLVANLSNLFAGYDPQRQWSVRAMVGLVADHTGHFSQPEWNAHFPYYYGLSNTAFGAKLGIQGAYRIDKNFELNAELSNTFLDNSYDGIEDDGNSMDGHLNILFGVSYYFGGKQGGSHASRAKASREERRQQAARERATAYRERQQRDNQNRVNEEKVKPAKTVVTPVVEEPVVEEVPYVDTSVNHAKYNLYFADRSSTLNTMAKDSISDAARKMRDWDNCDIYITVKGNKVENSDLFMERADAVRAQLLNEYFVPAGHVYIEKDPMLVRSVSGEKKCVIIYVEEQ